MPSTNYAYVNGRFLPEPEATVPIGDRGFLYGDGVFETMRIYGGKIFRLSHHQQRLLAGLRLLRIEPPLLASETATLLEQLIERNGISDGLARLYITRGPGRLGLGTEFNETPSVVAWAQPRTFAATAPGWRVIYAAIRLAAPRPLASVKTANRLAYILAKLEAEHAGVDDAVLLNDLHHVVEFSASNLFALHGDTLITPPVADGALPGITRAVVFQLAKTLGVPVQEKWFGPELLADLDELFATNSLIEIMPVIELDARPLGPPKFSLRLRDNYRQLVQKELAG